MRNLIKELIAYGLLVAASVFLLFICTLVAVYGGVVLYEANKIIVVTALAICVGMLALGIERLRNFDKKRRK